MMRRRDFITLLGGAAAAWPVAARAQQPEKLPLVGVLGSASPSSQDRLVGGFGQRLRDLGWVEGRTVAIEVRWAEGRVERADEIAAEFARLKVNVIVTSAAVNILAAKRAAPNTPIVFAIATDPVGTGLVASLERPGGNITGLSYMGTDLAAKRVELLRAILTTLRRIAVMAYNGAPGAMLELREVQVTAGKVGLEAISVQITAADQIAQAIAGLQDRADALYVCPDPLILANRALIISSAFSARLPTLFGEREFVDAGGLMSYGPNVPDMFRRAAEIVDKILRGRKPADIPVEQPTKFELVLNLKTAKALNLDVPAQLQQLADEVIE
jgi:putative ABC transport system substrate-binding protein